ncbi:class I SAM-dependent methyltransferase [Brevibacterium samyangense]|uniref:Methyltransferase n=1 Tax=Brevibacterium samyangense TaxID=366888 RepID=A0ABP5EKS1_9MICO
MPSPDSAPSGRTTPLAPVPTPSAETLVAFREVLVRAPFTAAGLRGLWGVDIDASLDRNNPAPARWWLRRHLSPEDPSGRGAPDSRAALAALFVLRMPVVREHVDGALGGDLAEALLTSGLLVTDADGRVSATLALAPYTVPTGVPRGTAPGDDTLYLFSDFGTLVDPEPVPGEFVLGLGGAGRTLAEITPRSPVTTALDLGTGCGIQALLLARHADRVVATDISPRALGIAALNAGLAGVTTIEFRQGSLFEPVPERFDLVVANPPFVITPQGRTTTLEYRDGGATGDGIMRALLTGTPDHLEPDGQAAFLGNWEYGPGRDLPTEWVSEPAGDTSVMVIERERMDPVTYAETWIRDGGVPRAGERWTADTEAWLEDFAAREVEAIGFGWVRMHRTDTPVRHFEELTGPLGANNLGTAAHLETRLGMLEWLAHAPDEELLRTAFVRAADVTEHRHFLPGDESPTMLTIDQGTGFGRTFEADPALAGLVGVADGSLDLGAVAGALAHLLEVDEAALTAQLLEQVRALVPAGVLFPAE